ncbi:MAG TPA: proline dehydrogenase family protein [Bacteroidota bacterium]
MNPMRSALLWASQNKTLSERLPRYRFVRKAVRRFMPGETEDDALQAAGKLKTEGFGTVLTYLGENITEMHEAEHVAEHYSAVLDKIHAQKLDCHLSVKLTQLGFDLDQEFCRQKVLALLKKASALHNFVWIDMESSAYVDRTLMLFKKLRSESNNVGLCLQAYLYRTGKDFQDLLQLSPVIRLVKGAYAEPKEVAYPLKKDVDRQYFELSKQLLAARSNGVQLGIGTHDSVLLGQITRGMETEGHPKNSCEFQMLYGIRTDQQERLVQKGYNVRVLISYGTHWFPWYMRRLAERPANVLFVLKNLFV